MTGIFGRENNVNEHWDPASVQLPQIPTLPPGEDPMSSMISAALPTLSAQMEANVAALQGKETMFAGKVAASNAMYSGSEDSGQQGVMQIVQMLGQMGGQAGQLGEVAGAPTQMFSQMGSQFGQLMQPMMQAFQGAGHGGHEQSPGGQGGAAAAGGGGQGPGGMSSAQQQERDDERSAQPQPETHHESERDGPGAPGAQAGPGHVAQGLTPVPPLPLEHPHQPTESDDPGRNL
jgi:hypothetical protein